VIVGVGRQAVEDVGESDNEKHEHDEEMPHRVHYLEHSPHQVPNFLVDPQKVEHLSP